MRSRHKIDGAPTSAHRSEMTLKQDGFVIFGEYVSAVSNEGKKAKGVLSGYVNGDLISFVVHWQGFQAIAAWVGQLNPSAPKPTINTLRQMTNQVEVGQEWASINAGADSFTRQ